MSFVSLSRSPSAPRAWASTASSASPPPPSPPPPPPTPPSPSLPDLRRAPSPASNFSMSGLLPGIFSTASARMAGVVAAGPGIQAGNNKADSCLPAFSLEVPTGTPALLRLDDGSERILRTLRFLGEGGFGAVVLAEERGEDGEWGQGFALKVMKGDCPQDWELEVENLEIVEEALDGAGMSMLWRGKNADQCFIALRFLRGGSLGGGLKQGGALSVSRCCQVLVDVLGALARLHELGGIHRDIKPDNLLVVSGDPGAQVVLGDWGFACWLDDGGLALGCAGTHGYAAPELMTGQAYGSSADLFSVGATAFALVTGRRPFYHDGDKGDAVAVRALGGAAALRWDHPIWGTEGGHELRSFITRMMDCEPGERPDTPGALEEMMILSALFPADPTDQWPAACLVSASPSAAAPSASPAVSLAACGSSSHSLSSSGSSSLLADSCSLASSFSVVEYHKVELVAPLRAGVIPVGPTVVVPVSGVVSSSSSEEISLASPVSSSRRCVESPATSLVWGLVLLEGIGSWVGEFVPYASLAGQSVVLSASGCSHSSSSNSNNNNKVRTSIRGNKNMGIIVDEESTVTVTVYSLDELKMVDLELERYQLEAIVWDSGIPRDSPPPATPTTTTGMTGTCTAGSRMSTATSVSAPSLPSSLDEAHPAPLPQDTELATPLPPVPIPATVVSGSPEPPSDPLPAEPEGRRALGKRAVLMERLGVGKEKVRAAGKAVLRALRR